MSKEFSIEHLSALMECVAMNKLEELLIETEDMKLRIKGRRETAPVPPAPMGASPVPAAVSAAPAASAAAPVSAAAPQFIQPRTIDSPIVGTFYASPAPDKDSFVQVGTQVKEGDIVFIVESMKVMNEVPADKSGTVAEILLASGSSVEYGQPVIRLE